MIRINFCDMYRDFDYEHNIYTDIIKKNFGEYECSDTPDFLIYSVFGTGHYKYHNCVKIFVTGEPVAPDFNQCDYAIGFDRISFGKRYLHNPVWLEEKRPNRNALTDEIALNRKFCNFVYSNDKNGPGAMLRKEFAKKLMQYKRVDCPGKVLNNMQDAIADRMDNWRKSKVEFISGYKFTIAFENSAYDGYTTEKMTEPMSANSIPIYWGNPSVEIDFNKNAFVNANGFEEKMDELVEKIIWLDTHDDEYLKMLRANPMSEQFDEAEMEHFEQFLVDILKRGNRSITKDPLQFARRMSVDNLSRKDKIKYFLYKR